MRRSHVDKRATRVVARQYVSDYEIEPEEVVVEESSRVLAGQYRPSNKRPDGASE
jgi:hypothetical protein